MRWWIAWWWVWYAIGARDGGRRGSAPGARASAGARESQSERDPPSTPHAQLYEHKQLSIGAHVMLEEAMMVGTEYLDEHPEGSLQASASV